MLWSRPTRWHSDRTHGRCRKGTFAFLSNETVTLLAAWPPYQRKTNTEITARDRCGWITEQVYGAQRPSRWGVLGQNLWVKWWLWFLVGKSIKQQQRDARWRQRQNNSKEMHSDHKQLTNYRQHFVSLSVWGSCSYTGEVGDLLNLETTQVLGKKTWANSATNIKTCSQWASTRQPVPSLLL